MNEYGFYPLKKGLNKDIVTDNKHMRCIDEEYEIQGDFDSYSARNLMIVFDICNPKLRTCKSKKFIEYALAASYVQVVQNEQHYNH